MNASLFRISSKTGRVIGAALAQVDEEGQIVNTTFLELPARYEDAEDFIARNALPDTVMLFQGRESYTRYLNAGNLPDFSKGRVLQTEVF